MDNPQKSTTTITSGSLSLLLSCILLIGVSSPVIAQDSFALIINQENAISGSREEMINLISRLFLKKGKMWPDSEITCRPFDRAKDSRERQNFVAHILEMNEMRLSDHWAKMKQLRGDTPPRKIKSTRILLKLIEKNPGAFGVISRQAASNLPKSVKVLFYF